jgi:oligopeptide transport system substrate-binding protein
MGSEGGRNQVRETGRTVAGRCRRRSRAATPGRSGAATALSLAALLSACPTWAEILNRPVGQVYESLDPQKTVSAEAAAIERDMFTGLAALDDRGRPISGAAASWEISADGRTWIFHLRPALRWSNGDPLTADDFVYSFRRLVDPRTGAADASDLDPVENAAAIRGGAEPDVSRLGVVAPDAATLRVTLREPSAAFRFLLADPRLSPLHRATIERWGDAWARPGNIVSDGPYAMRSGAPKGEIRLARNVNFYDAAAVPIDEVRWVAASDREPAIGKFRAGRLDYLDLAAEDLPSARRAMPELIRSAPAGQPDYLCFNMSKGPLAHSPPIREAINLAIDRDALAALVDPPGAKPAYGIESPLAVDHAPQSMAFRDQPMPQRLDTAKALMKEAGYGPARRLSLVLTYASDDTAREMPEAIRAMLRPIGIELALERLDRSSFDARARRRDFEIGWISGIGGTGDDEAPPGAFRSGAGLFNVAVYANADFDDLFHRAMAEMDPEKRRGFAEAAERMMLAAYPVAPLYFGIRSRLVSARLRDLPDDMRFPQSRYLRLEEPAP